ESGDWSSFASWGPVAERRTWIPSVDEAPTLAGHDAAEVARLVLPGPDGHDRGRYLWVRIELEGARKRATDSLAIATPSVAGLRLLMPRRVGLERLPAIFARADEL